MKLSPIQASTFLQEAYGITLSKGHRNPVGVHFTSIERACRNGELPSEMVKSKGRYGTSYRIAESDLKRWYENKRNKILKAWGLT